MGTARKLENNQKKLTKKNTWYKCKHSAREISPARKKSEVFMYYIIDLQTTEKAETLARALEIAHDWIEYERETVAALDDDEIMDALKPGGLEWDLENGDVEIWEADADAANWYDGERVERYSGRAITEAEAEKRGIKYRTSWAYRW